MSASFEASDHPELPPDPTCYEPTEWPDFETGDDPYSITAPADVYAEADLRVSDRELPHEVSEVDVVVSFNEQGYVAEALDIAEQRADTSRTTPIVYVKSRAHTGPADLAKIGVDTHTMTVHDALQEYDGLLQTYLEMGIGDEGSRELANALRCQLTFIDSREYDQAAAGLGRLWKSYLDSDPDATISVPTAISDRNNVRKSDTELRERILDTFTDEELEHYGGRILPKVEHSDHWRDPKHRIILLDDWTITGAQMEAAYDDITRTIGYTPNVEANFITATERHLANGFNAATPGTNAILVPVRAFYKAHSAPETAPEGSHISGTHSSVDHNFGVPLEALTKQLRQDTNQEFLTIPALASIVRRYRRAEPRIIFHPDGRITRR